MIRFLAAIALFLAMLPAMAQDTLSDVARGDDDRSVFTAFIERRLSSPDRRISISGIQGALSSEASIGEITIADREGVWLRIVNASINWSRSALLLRQRLEVQRLAADRIEVLRRPLPPRGLPAPESRSFQVPELPIAVNLEQLEVPFARFGETVFGLASELSLDGALRIESGTLDTNLDIRRLDGPGGHLRLATTFSNETRELDLDLALEEPGNGVVSNMLNIEGRPPLALTLAGSGPLGALDVKLSLATDGVPTFGGTVSLRERNEGLGFSARFAGPIARLVPSKFRSYFGSGSIVTANGVAHEGGGVLLQNLRLSNASTKLEAAAETSPDGFLTALSLDVAIASANDERVLLPIGDGNTTLQTAHLTIGYGEAGSERWSGRLAVDDLQTSEFSAGKTELSMGGFAQNLNHPAQRRVSFEVNGGVTEITASRPEMAEALGEAIMLDVVGDWRAGTPVALSRAALSGNGLSLTLDGAIDNFVFDGNIAAAVSSLAPFSGLAGQDLGGGIDVTARGQVMPITSGFELELDGTATDLNLPNEVADRLLAGTTVLEGGVARNADGLTARRLRLVNEQMTLEADGNYATGSANFRFDAAIVDMKHLNEQATGPLNASGRAEGGEGRINLTLVAAAPSGELAGKTLSDAAFAFDGQLEDVTLTGQIIGDAQLAGEAVALSGGIVLGEETRHLTDFSFRAGGAEATGNLIQRADGLITGQFDVDAPDISTAAALFLQQATGSAEAHIVLNPGNGRQKADVNAALRNIESASARISEARLQAIADDLFGVPVVDGTLAADGVSAGNLLITRLQAEANQSGETTHFSAHATLDQGTRLATRGALAPEGSGYRIGVEELTLNQGNVAARLISATSLFVEGSNFTLDPLELDVAGGRVSASGKVAETLNLDLMIRRVPLSIVNAVRPDLGLGGMIDGSASMRGTRDAPEVRFDLAGREVAAAALRQAGLSAMSVDAKGTTSGERLNIDASLTSPEGFRASARGNVPLGDGALALDASATAPLSIANRFLVERGTQLSGTVNAEARITGTTAKPIINGRVSTANASAVDPITNLRVNDIRLAAGIAGERVTISEGSATLAAGGRISVTGNLSTNATAGFPASLAIRLDNARYADGEMVSATVNGALTLEGPLTRDPLLAGNINIERAEIIVPDGLGGGAATLNVHHVAPPPAVQRTLEYARAEDGTPMPSSRPSVMRLNVNVAAPARIFVRGRGLDAELGGSVRLTGPVTSIQPVGAFDLIRGRLSILTQRITFQEGRVTLVGDLDPQLYFLASSQASDLTAFITVSGRLSDLEITLSSQPELPQDEVLARLIFKRGIDDLSAVQIAQLAAAAAELAGGNPNNSLLGSLRNATGLDDLDIVSDDEGNTAVRAGRYVQDNIYLGVEAGSRGTTRGTVNLDITENLKARGSLGSDGDSRVGVFYEKDY